jgi:hypothetical protein
MMVSAMSYPCVVRLFRFAYPPPIIIGSQSSNCELETGGGQSFGCPLCSGGGSRKSPREARVDFVICRLAAFCLASFLFSFACFFVFPLLPCFLFPCSLFSCFVSFFRCVLFPCSLFGFFLLPFPFFLPFCWVFCVCALLCVVSRCQINSFCPPDLNYVPIC